MVAFPCRIGAPVTGITLSTRVGRLSRTHFELGLSVNAIATLGRKAIEQHGAKSDNLEMFEHRLFHLTSISGRLQRTNSGKPVCGRVS